MIFFMYSFVHKTALLIKKVELQHSLTSIQTIEGCSRGPRIIVAISFEYFCFYLYHSS